MGVTWFGRLRAERDSQRFVLRWIAAVALSMIAAGAVEYAVGSYQLEESALEEALDGYKADLPELEDALAADLTPAARLRAIRLELEHIMGTEGTDYVALLDADGEAIDALGGHATSIEMSDVRRVIASGEPSAKREADVGQRKGENRYEFLLPVSAPNGSLIMEVDQHAEVIGEQLADLRLRLALGLLLGVLLAVPLSYLLGGRTLHRQQKRAEATADTDALTGLPGRRPFRPALEAALASPATDGLVLALIDIDGFKQVNDRLGHTYGDRVLCALAESFEALRASDTAFRLGGDEFAVVMANSNDQQAGEALERVRESLAERAPGITFSCGIAFVQHQNPVSVQELWERADAALYDAKATGRRRTSSFNTISTRLAVTVEKLDAVSALLAEGGGLSVAFQPIWDLRAGRILGHEALLRLPTGTPINGPEEAFELAHRLGVAAELDERARDTVLRHVRTLTWRGLLFINVHPDALPHLDVDALITEIARAALVPGDVILEVTEHAGLDRPDPVRVLKRAHSRGFRLALDDMGKGNAGLQALTHVRFDVLKLDRQVVARLGIDPASDAALAAATTFVDQTGGWIVAEGIEDVETLTAVLGDTDTDRPCSDVVIAGQGYLLGRPSSAPLAIDTDLETLVQPGRQASPL